MAVPEHWRKRAIVIEAMQYTGGMESRDEIIAWSTGAAEELDGHLVIITLEGVMRAHVGDWVIKGVKGEFYPCDPAVFKGTYDRA